MTDNPKYRYIKAYEPWSTIFVTDPIAIPLAPLLASLKISPNSVTMASLVLGICSGVAFGFGHWIWGAVIFELAFFMDCLDGKIARLRNMTSDFGKKLDVFADWTRKPSSFLGIAVYFYLGGQLLFCFFTIVAFVAHLAIHKGYALCHISEYDMEFPGFHRRVLRRFVPRLLNLHNFFDEQFIQFTVFPLIAGIIGMPAGGVWFLYGSALVVCVGLLKLFNSLHYQFTGRYDEIYQDWTGTGGNLDKAVK
jgi:phosphatidylglycerophosphate synthase